MNTDTPETDKYADADWWTLFRATEHCRKLERERDEAREQRDRLAEQIEANHKGTLMLEQMVYDAREQRDRLAEALERLEKTAGLPALHDDPARIKARKALQYLTISTQTEPK